MKRGVKKNKPEVSLWLIDGFIGILALVVYNLLIYILDLTNLGGLISKIQDAMGYFGINSFIDFGFTTFQIATGVLITFTLSFFLGILVGYIVRKIKDKK